MTVQFLRDMRDAASRDWLTLKQGRGAAVDHSELRPFELDAARRRNESVRQKLGEAEILDALVMRRMAETLEVSDPASLPEKAISPRRDTFMAGGAFVGLLSGLLVAFARRQGSRNSPAPEANS
jgi:LPS O-antigen subunit length determinant protein (WzzB/FepE family)